MVGAALTTKYVFDVQPDDVYWCTADCGWITGHSYVTYGMTPLVSVWTTQGGLSRKCFCYIAKYMLYSGFATLLHAALGATIWSGM